MIKKSIVRIRLTARDACMFDEHLTSDARVIYYAVDFHAGWKDVCWPSLETLAHETGLTTRRAQRAIALLRHNNYIAVDRKRREPAEYRLIREAHQELPLVVNQEIKNDQKRDQEWPLVDFVSYIEPGIEPGSALRSEDQKQETQNRAFEDFDPVEHDRRAREILQAQAAELQAGAEQLKTLRSCAVA